MRFAFDDLAAFTRIYHKYIGNKWLLFLLTAIIPAFLDGVGITMLIPFLNLVMYPDVSYQSVNGENSDFAYRLLTFLQIPLNLTNILFFISAIYLLKFLIAFINNAYKSYMYASLVKNMRYNLYNRIMDLDYSVFRERNTGYYTNIVGVQMGQFLFGFTVLTQFYTKIFTSLSYLAFSLFIDWKFSLLAAVSGIIVIGSFRSFNKRIKQLSKQTTEQESLQTSFFIQGVQAFKYLAATGSFSIFKEKLRKSVDEIRKQRLQSELIRSFYDASYEPLSVFLICFLIWFQVATMGKPLASMILSIFLFYKAMGNILITQKDWQLILNYSGSIQSVYSEFESSKLQQEKSGSLSLRTLLSRITFENVSFAYGNKPVVKKINLEIPPNTTVALVGESGAGKTTISDLLTFLLKPQDGSILIGNVPYDEINLSEIRKRVGFISQEVHLFDDTVANNISLWKADYNTKEGKEQIENAAKLAFCDDFIRDNEMGYLAKIGDRGVKLSGGQRQRLAIARELFKHPELLIMDEATSALDSESENYIKQTLSSLRGKMTIVMIAHRLSTVKEADKIIVLKNGVIEDEGSFEQLIMRKGYFSELVAFQKL